MPDGIPSIETRFPVAIMKYPSRLLDVPINYGIQGGESFAFCLNQCSIECMNITAEESGCAGLFCDKQRILEVRRYNQGCCCYSFDSRRANMIIDHTLNIRHHSLQEIMHVPNYSSVKFSLHYQSAVFSTQVRQTSLDLTESYFNLDDSVDKVIELINDNGGFTVIGWYKRGEVMDRTILHQNNNTANIQNNVSSNEVNTQVDNSKITFHPCVIRATNPDFYTTNSVLYKTLEDMKFDVGQLLQE